MLNCLIVDDELLAIDVIEGYVRNVPFLKLCGSYSNAMEALSHLQKEKIDLIFLDIQMPKLSGIQFMNILKGRAQVIIISAYSAYALQGYDHDVIDYLLKPVSFERFFKSVEKCYTSVNALTDRETNPPLDFMFIRADNKIVKICFNEILYIEGLKNYISIYTNNTPRIVSLISIKDLEEKLPSHKFVRVQKSYIVNLEKIDTIERQRIFIDKKSIPIGETYSANFFSIIKTNGK